MTENSLVVSHHGLSQEQLIAWFSEHVCEVAVCLPWLTKIARNEDGAVQAHDEEHLVELCLENETEIAEHRFSRRFPTARVRRVSGRDRLLVAGERCADDEAIMVFSIGGGDTGTEQGSSTIGIRVALRRGDGGGTGSKLWSGGMLLAEWLARGAGWRGSAQRCLDIAGKDVLELGAGIAALPSIVAAKSGALRVLATDGLADIVDAMQRNIEGNAPSVETGILKWAVAGQTAYPQSAQFDVILFADAIYTERGALLLADTLMSLIRPHGVIVGALPNLRVGVSSFEDDMRIRGFEASVVDLDSTVLQAASRQNLPATPDLVAGGSLDGYLLVIWRHSSKQYPSGHRGLRKRRGKFHRPGVESSIACT